jgi:hypothetical protein
VSLGAPFSRCENRHWNSVFNFLDEQENAAAKQSSVPGAIRTSSIGEEQSMSYVSMEVRLSNLCHYIISDSYHTDTLTLALG